MTSPVIDATLLLPTLLAAAAYTLTPGPAFLALLGIGATQGRRAGIGFLAGHLAGDVVWASLALIAIIGAQSLGTMVFDLLGLACGLYLCWLGWKAASTRRDADPQAALGARRPLVRGLTFGLMNPKGYPVAVATFTSLLASRSQDLSWERMPLLLLAAFAGFILADAVLAYVVGAGLVRRFYRRHQLWVTRASGLLFIGFGLNALWHSTHGLWSSWRRAA
ncbi:MAG TPA: LysE family translocator [Dongiaceae bacterium]|jgi:threonine/homoserine/homoserine lactone efflux protein|nr:LysE family translocator [Dongiaceae bacterium]